MKRNTRKIIIELIHHEMTTDEISKQFNLSNRMVKVYIKDIRDFLSQYQLGHLEYKKPYYIFSGDKKRTIRIINSESSVINEYSSNERRLEILYQLMMNDNVPIKIEKFADKLGVSTSSVVNDIRLLNKDCHDFDVFVSGGKNGELLAGSEFNKRICLVSLYISKMDQSTKYTTTQLLENGVSEVAYSVFWRLFEKIDVNEVEKIIQVIKSLLSVNLTDTQYLYVCGLLCALLKRVGRSERLEDRTKRTILSEQAILQLKKAIQTISGVFIPECEDDYINYILEVSSVDYSIIIRDLNPDQYRKLSSEIIDQANRLADIGRPETERLYQEIQYEILTIERERELKIPRTKNLVQLRTAYFQLMFDIVKSVLENNDYYFNEDEIWRIASIIFNYFSTNEFCITKNILIVTDKPKSMTKTFATKLTEMFCVNVIDIVGIGQINTYLKMFPVDYIVSTIHLREYENVICVHPLLDERDLISLKEKLPIHINNAEKAQRMTIYSIGEVDSIEDFLAKTADYLQSSGIIDAEFTELVQLSWQATHECLLQKGEVAYFPFVSHTLPQINVEICARFHHLMNEEVRGIRMVITTNERNYMLFLEREFDDNNESQCDYSRNVVC